MKLSHILILTFLIIFFKSSSCMECELHFKVYYTKDGDKECIVICFETGIDDGLLLKVSQKNELYKNLKEYLEPYQNVHKLPYKYITYVDLNLEIQNAGFKIKILNLKNFIYFDLYVKGKSKGEIPKAEEAKIEEKSKGEIPKAEEAKIEEKTKGEIPKAEEAKIEEKTNANEQEVIAKGKEKGVPLERSKSITKSISKSAIAKSVRLKSIKKKQQSKGLIMANKEEEGKVKEILIANETEKKIISKVISRTVNNVYKLIKVGIINAYPVDAMNNIACCLRLLTIQNKMNLLSFNEIQGVMEKFNSNKFPLYIPSATGKILCTKETLIDLIKDLPKNAKADIEDNSFYHIIRYINDSKHIEAIKLIESDQRYFVNEKRDLSGCGVLDEYQKAIITARISLNNAKAELKIPALIQSIYNFNLDVADDVNFTNNVESNQNDEVSSLVEPIQIKQDTDRNFQIDCGNPEGDNIDQNINQSKLIKKRPQETEVVARDLNPNDPNNSNWVKKKKTVNQQNYSIEKPNITNNQTQHNLISLADLAKTNDDQNGRNNVKIGKRVDSKTKVIEQSLKDEQTDEQKSEITLEKADKGDNHLEK
jgi:hypothetical protein